MRRLWWAARRRSSRALSRRSSSAGSPSLRGRESSRIERLAAAPDLPGAVSAGDASPAQVLVPVRVADHAGHALALSIGAIEVGARHLAHPVGIDRVAQPLLRLVPEYPRIARKPDALEQLPHLRQRIGA